MRPQLCKTLGHMLAFRDVLTRFPLAKPRIAQQSSPASQSSASQVLQPVFCKPNRHQNSSFFFFFFNLRFGWSSRLTLHCYGRAWNGAAWTHGWLCNTLTACLCHMKKQTPSTAWLAGGPKKRSRWSYTVPTEAPVPVPQTLHFLTGALTQESF